MKILTLIGILLFVSAAAFAEDQPQVEAQPPQEPGPCQLIAEATGITFEQNDTGGQCAISSPSRQGEITAEKAVWEVHISCKSRYNGRTGSEMIYTYTVDIENGQCGKAHLVMF